MLMSAEEIQAMWSSEAQATGQNWLPTDTINKLLKTNTDLDKQNEALQKQVETLVKKVNNHQSSTANIREQLNVILKKHGIEAAFEPLIEMATERYPDDFAIESLRGMFKCDVDQRIKIWTEILSYQLPKLKAMEVSGQIDNSITVMVRRFGNDTVVERKVSTTPIVDAEVVTEKKTKGSDLAVTRKF